MKPLLRIFAGSFLVAFFMSGCATYTNETAQVRSAFRARNFSGALEYLKKAGVATQDRSRLLYLMETAMILDRQGNRKEARKLLIQADKLADELYTVSVSKTAATLIVNESMSDYSGEDYERVSIHTMLALSFLEDKQYEEARVEAKKINNRLHVIAKDRGSDTNAYKEDAFARYLSGLIFEALGDTDDAFIDYRKALDLFENPGYKQFYFGGSPRTLVERVAVMAAHKDRPEVLRTLEQRYPKWVPATTAASASDTGDVVIVHETGFIAVKVAKEFALPIAGQIVRFSFPYIEQRSASQSSMTGVEFQGRFTQADNVADLTALAHYSLEDKRLRLIVKNGVRLLAKGQLTDQAYQHLGPLGGIAANVYSVVTETADTRGWTLLPEAFYITRLRLPVGKQTIQIKNEGRINQVLTVDVKKGQVQLLRDCVR